MWLSRCCGGSHSAACGSHSAVVILTLLPEQGVLQIYRYPCCVVHHVCSHYACLIDSFLRIHACALTHALEE